MDIKIDSVAPLSNGHKRGVSSTTEQKQMLFEHDIKVQDEKYENTWQSCCITVDKRAVQYFTQVLIICSIMAFNIYQLISLKDGSNQITYMSLLTFLIGILVPSPKMSD